VSRADSVTDGRVVTVRRLAGVVLTVAGLAAIVIGTLTPSRAHVEPGLVWCLTCSSLATADALANVLLFLPAGVGLGLLAPRALLAVAGLALVSIGVEGAQAWIVPGRASALRDVLTNTLGGAIGIGLASHPRAWLLPHPAAARRFALLGALAWAGTLGATAALTRPSTPSGDYWGQRGGVSGFGASVVHVALNDTPLPLGPLSDPGPILASLNSADVRVDVQVTPSSLPFPNGAIARLSNPRVEAFRIAKRADDLVFRLRLRSADVRLRSPIVRLSGGGRTPEPPVGAPVADTLRIRAGVRDGVLHLARDGPVADAELRLSPTIGWAFLVPSAINYRTPAWLLGVLWVALLCLPIGYWTAAAGGLGHRRAAGNESSPGRWTMPLGVATIVLGALALIPIIADTPWSPWWDWCAAGLALLAGAAATKLTPAAARRPVPAPRPMPVARAERARRRARPGG
jgi:hypothetical protein